MNLKKHNLSRIDFLFICKHSRRLLKDLEKQLKMMRPTGGLCFHQCANRACPENKTCMASSLDKIST